MLSISGIFLSCTASIMFFYIKYHETPVVKPSNMLLSDIQLSAQMMFIIIMPFIFIRESNTIIRTLRSNLVPIDCIYIRHTKYNKNLMRIFDSEIKLTIRERTKIKATKLCLLCVYILIDG